MSAWIFALLCLLSPPAKMAALPAFPGWAETVEQRTARYQSMADDIAAVVSDPAEAPAVGGKLGRRYNDKGTIYVRPFRKGEVDDVTRRRVRGALSGDEVDWAQATRRFTLVLIYWGDEGAPVGFYPHLVVPPDLPPHVFNPL